MTVPVAIHVDGGPGVGLGHAARGVGLAAALRACGWRPVVLIAGDPVLAAFVSQHGCETATCAPTGPGLLGACADLGAVGLVIDSYRITDADLAVLTAGLALVACFDDTAERALPVDLVVNGSPAAATLRYEGRAQTRWLLGAEYQVVRPAFSEDAARDYHEPPRAVLVMTGGADPLGVLDRLAQLFATRPAASLPGAQVEIVAGPFADTSPAASARVRWHRNPRDVRSLMLAADLAVSAGGQTLYELARCGTPTVAFCASPHQAPNLDALARLGAIEYVGWATAADWPARIETALARLWVDGQARERLGRRAAQVIDGRGAGRVAEAIGHLLASRTATAVDG